MNKISKKVFGLIIIISTLIFSACSSKSTETIELAFESINAQEYEEALNMLQTARENGEDERQILRAEGIANLGLGKHAEAIEKFEASLAASEGTIIDMDYDINYYLATAYYKNGNADEALKIYDTIISLEPNSVDAIYLKGVIIAEKNDLNQAMACFDQAIALAPENYDMLIQIYSILNEKGYQSEGQSYLKRALESGTQKMTNFEKGQISFYLEDYESAKTYLEKAKDEDSYEAVLFLGKTYETLGDVNYAISVYTSYLSSGAKSPEVLNQMGLCKLSMGDYEGALSAFVEAMNIEGNGMMQTLKYNEIVAYEYLGDFKKACVLMESYLRSFPDDEAAQREYLFLKNR